MDKVIAVEDTLSNVKEYLTARGCRVIGLDAATREVDAVVLSGGRENLMGIQKIELDAPVIDARGLSPGEIWDSIQNRA